MDFTNQVPATNENVKAHYPAWLFMDSYSRAVEPAELVEDELTCRKCGQKVTLHAGTINECPNCKNPVISCCHVCDYKFTLRSIQSGVQLFLCGPCLKAQLKHRDIFRYWMLIL